jgi:hypothetical protein
LAIDRTSHDEPRGDVGTRLDGASPHILVFNDFFNIAKFVENEPIIDHSGEVEQDDTK